LRSALLSSKVKQVGKHKYEAYVKDKKGSRCEKGHLIEVDNIVSDMDGYVFVEKGQCCTAHNRGG